MYKRLLSLLTAICLTLSMAAAVPAFAADTADSGETVSRYYGSQLTDPAAIAFYNALQAMDFASGENVSMTDEAILTEAAQYEAGDTAIAESFGAALDAFFMDRTDLFYVDWSNFSFSVGKKDGAYIVTLSAGRAASYLKVEGDELNAMRSEHDAAMETALAAIEAELGEDATVREKAAAVNAWLIANVDYGFAKDENGDETAATAYVRTTYGALVNGVAICEGYARTFKALMNHLGAACELVGGYLIQGDSVEPHIWNYVRDEDGDWYAVDVTGNDTCESEKLYFWRTEEVFFANHMEDPVISASGYSMPYPQLRKFWETPTSSGLFDVEMAYSPSGQLSMAVSYDGMNATELRDGRGLYMAFRVSTTNESGTPDTENSPWQSFEMYQKTYAGIYEEAPGVTYFMGADEHIWSIEVAIFDCADNALWSTISKQMYYDQEAIDTHMVEMTTIYNPCNDPDYKVPAYIDYAETSPARLFQERQDITQTQHITVAFDTNLAVMDGCTEDDFTVTYDVQAYNNRDLVKEKVFANAKIENIEWDGANKVSFDFTPSRSYNHNMIWYQFSIEGLTNLLADGSKSNIAIPAFPIAYAYTDTIACKSILAGTNPYMKAYAQPTLTSVGDLSMEGWTYADGTKVCEAERSQMALVVTVPNDSEELAEAAEALAGENAVLQSYTYEIDLNVCGSIVNIPNGTKLTLNLGIPDSVDLSDPNTVFKLYHFKRNADGTLDYNNPEIIDCAITEYGIIALVDSFSPYVLVALDNSLLPEGEQVTSKSILLNLDSTGGTVTSSGILSGALCSGETVTYTVTPDEGYLIEYVAVNGIAVTLSEGNTLTLDYDDVDASTVIRVGFVASSVKAAEEAAGITPMLANVTTEDIKTCTIIFNANNGSDSKTAVTVSFTGDSCVYTMPAVDFTWENHDFLNWNTAADGSGQAYEAGDQIDVTGSNIVFYAIWQTVATEDPIAAYTITYDGNGGSGDVTDAMLYLSGDVCIVKDCAFARDGYTFASWNTAADGSGQTVSAGASIRFADDDIVLYAIWTEAGTESGDSPGESGDSGSSGGSISDNGNSGSGNMGNTSVSYTLTFECNGGEALDSGIYPSGVLVKLPVPVAADHAIFLGWYSDKELTKPVSEVTMTANTTVYAKWYQIEVPALLNSTTREAYINGYSDGLFHPASNLTRAEAAAIFYRILRSEAKAEAGDAIAPWTDVADDAWYADAAACLNSLGIMMGRSEATFAPNATITRAEFATICVRLAGELDEELPLKDFSDVDGHWAASYIQTAAALGWVNGYSDGSFRPDDPITRAEAVAVINRVLQRSGLTLEDAGADGMRTFADNADTGAWYYLDIQEAANTFAGE